MESVTIMDTIHESPLTPSIYEKAESFCFDKAKVKRNGKYGFMDNSDNIVLPVAYDKIGSWSDGLANILQEDKWGFVNRQGRKQMTSCH